MKIDIALRWVEALRSGNYLQGKHNLLSYGYDMDTGDQILMHCALGVLCEIAVHDGVVKRHDDPDIDANGIWLGDEGMFLPDANGFGAYVDLSIEPEELWHENVDAPHAGFAQVLPEAVMLWAEMSYNDGRTSSTPPITVLNDDENRSFAEIANHIERIWETL